MGKRYETSLEAKLEGDVLSIEAKIWFSNKVNLKVFLGVNKVVEVKDSNVVYCKCSKNDNEIKLNGNDWELFIQLDEKYALVNYRGTAKYVKERDITYINNAPRIEYPGGELRVSSRILKKL